MIHVTFQASRRMDTHRFAPKDCSTAASEVALNGDSESVTHAEGIVYTNSSLQVPRESKYNRDMLSQERGLYL